LAALNAAWFIAAAMFCARPATSISRVCSGITSPAPAASRKLETTISTQFPTASAAKPCVTAIAARLT
tara:strand:- start:11 stop:214 length:204 start_codon:yes stop_codon:yes gene_type:complete